MRMTYTEGRGYAPDGSEQISLSGCTSCQYGALDLSSVPTWAWAVMAVAGLGLVGYGAWLKMHKRK